MSKKGLLLVISGPAGVGKGTIVRKLIERNPGMRISVSCTTRDPRPGETDGVSYWFISKDEFEKRIEEGDFLEYMRVFHGNYYGTPLSKVTEQREAGLDVILEINVDGALLVKQKEPAAKLIFIMPPSFEELKKRLSGRGTETEEQMAERLGKAAGEIEIGKSYDYRVVNDTVERAVCEIEEIVAEEHDKENG